MKNINNLLKNAIVRRTIHAVLILAIVYFVLLAFDAFVWGHPEYILVSLAGIALSTWLIKKLTSV